MVDAIVWDVWGIILFYGIYESGEMTDVKNLRYVLCEWNNWCVFIHFYPDIYLYLYIYLYLLVCIYTPILNPYLLTPSSPDSHP